MCLPISTRVSAQTVEVYGRVGVAGSTPLIRDQVVSAQMAQLLGAAVNDEVTAVPKIGPAFGAGARFGFWPQVALVVDAEWAPTELEARDGSGTRPIQDLSVLQATVGAQWAVRRAIELGAGVGLLWYRSEGTGLFDSEMDRNGVIEGSVAWTPSFWDDRLALVGTARTHRFSNSVLREAGGTDGSVTRFGVSMRVRLAEKSQ